MKTVIAMSLLIFATSASASILSKAQGNKKRCNHLEQRFGYDVCKFEKDSRIVKVKYDCGDKVVYVWERENRKPNILSRANTYNRVCRK